MFRHSNNDEVTRVSVESRMKKKPQVCPIWYHCKTSGGGLQGRIKMRKSGERNEIRMSYLVTLAWGRESGGGGWNRQPRYLI